MSCVRKRTRIDAKKKKHITFQIDVVDENGMRRRFGFPTEAAAIAAMRKHEERMQRAARDTGETIADACASWLDNRQYGIDTADKVEPSTLRRYRSHVELHINPEIGNVRMVDLTEEMGTEFRDNLLKTGSRPMAAKILLSLKSAVKLKCKSMKIPNPLSDLRVKVNKRDKKALRVPAKADVGAMLKAADELAKMKDLRTAIAWRRYRPFILVAVHTGARMSEIRGLIWRNILWKDGLIRITQRADEDHVLGTPKSETSTRDIPVPSEVLDALREWKEICPAHSASIKVAGGKNLQAGTDLVFPNRKGKVESLSNIVARCWIPLMKQAKLFDPVAKKARYVRQELRHFYASIHIDAGATVKDIQMLMGHSSAQVTLDIYSKLFDSRDMRNARQVRVSEIAAEIRASAPKDDDVAPVGI